MLVERHKLTSGSTWHAAGLVGQLRTSANITQLLKYSVELYDRLEAETGLATGWKRNGGLRLACNAERMTEIKRQATTAHSFGLEMHLLTPKEALDLWPLMDVADLVGAAFLPTDGQANPADIAQALAKGARAAGVAHHRGLRGHGHRDEARAGSPACVTAEGDDRLRGGRQLRRPVGAGDRALAGVCVPLQSVQHQYLVTEPIAGVPRDLPTLRDPDRLHLFQGGGRRAGHGRLRAEPDPLGARAAFPRASISRCSTPTGIISSRSWTQALARVPALETAGIKRMINGPECFTPDGNFILGEAPELRELLRRRRLQRLRHRRAPAAPAGRSPNGSPTARRRWISGRSTSAASAAPSRPALGAGPHAGGLWQALHHGLAA